MHRKSAGLLLLLIGAASIVFLAPSTVQALPRYSARYGQKCLLCHQNPTGGGMRSPYASQYLVPTEMAVTKRDPEAAPAIDPQLNESISTGADLRTLFRYSDDALHRSENNVFQMQGDIYLHFQLDERLSAYIDQGMNGHSELYGMGFILPAGGYFKVGKFTPAYGWKFDDHTQFVRDQLGFAPPLHTDVGVELGAFPGDASLNFAVLNGAPGNVMDSDGKPAFAARGELRRSFGPLRLAAGGSWYRSKETEVERFLLGPFFYLSWGPFSWLGEWDWERLKNDESLTALVTSHEVTWTLWRGLNLRGTYNFKDPDTDYLTGSFSKTGAGADVLITPSVGLLAMLNFYDFEEGHAVQGKGFKQAELVLHFLY